MWGMVVHHLVKNNNNLKHLMSNDVGGIQGSGITTLMFGNLTLFANVQCLTVRCLKINSSSVIPPKTIPCHMLHSYVSNYLS